MRNIIAMILVMLLVIGFWIASHVPAVWLWMNEPAWHWGLVAAVGLGLLDRLVKLTTWKGDDALWAIFKKEILGRKGK